MVSCMVTWITSLNLAALVVTQNGQKLDEFLKAGPETKFSNLAGARCSFTILMDMIRLQGAYGSSNEQEEASI